MIVNVPYTCSSARKYWLPLVALLAPLLAGCAPRAAPSKAEPAKELAPVATATVLSRDYAVPIEAIGTARAWESVLVSSRVNGRVSQVFMQEGASIRQGEPVVRLEDDTEHAELRSAKAAAEQSRSRYQRMQELDAKGLVAHDDLDAQRQLLDTTQAKLELAQSLLDQRTIRAPFSGKLGFRMVSLGALVQPGTAIVALDATDTMRVAFSVAETLIPDLAVGGIVNAQAAAFRGHNFIGKIHAIGTRVDDVTRAVPVQAVIDNRAGLLKPGMMLNLSILTKSRPLTYVPEAALAPENTRQFVWRIAADNTAEKVSVELGLRTQGWVEILSGVTVGDRIVIEGVGNLRPGRAVREVPRPGANAERSPGES